MIKVTDTYAISVDEYNYTTGKIYTDKEGKSILIKTRYFSSLFGAIEDIFNRVTRDRLQGVDYNLFEATKVIQESAKEFSEILSKLRKELSLSAEETKDE